MDAYLAAQNGTNGFPPYGSFNPVSCRQKENFVLSTCLTFSFTQAGRAYPDVAALADGIPMVDNGQTVLEGGTSASSPEFAGIVALLNDVRVNNGLLAGNSS